MLVCPSCDSTNPDTHKFCQRCGTSLIEKDCPKCSAKVPYDAAFCPNCRQFTGQIWRVSIEPLLPVVGEIEPVSTDLVSDLSLNAVSTQVSPVDEIKSELQPTSLVEVQLPVEEINSQSPPSQTTEAPSPVEEIDSEIQSTSSVEVQLPVDEINLELQPTSSVEVQLPVEEINSQSPPSQTTEAPSPVDEIDSELQPTSSVEVRSPVDEINLEIPPSQTTEVQPPVDEIAPELPPSQTTEVQPPVDEIDPELDESKQISDSANEFIPDSLPKADSDSTDNVVENSIPVSPQVENTYLDSQQRYKLFNTDLDNLKVLDVKPLQATVLSALPNLRAIARGKDNLGQSQLDIPKIAIDYLQIKEKCPSNAIPIVHDAWQDSEKIVLLLEDRSQWATLSEFWSIPEVQTTKILTWMSQMAELWAALEVEGYRQSLLNIDNLKLDEDETIALERLYADGEGSDEIELQALGEVWHQLFGQSAKTQFLSLSQMLRSMCNGEIKDINQLKSELRGVHEELQPTASATGATDSIDGDLNILQGELEEIDESPTLVLPKRLTAIEDAGATHPGKQRPYNEDFFAIETKVGRVEYPDREDITARGLYILCDGMGGHAGGEVASKTAVKIIKDFFEERWEDSLPDEDTIKESIFLANQELYNLNQKNASSGTGRMGTTLVMLLIHNTKAAIAHVGDSRLYCITKQRGLQRLTVDHEVGQREIQRGVEESIAYSRPDAYQLTQALGPRDRNFIKPDVKFIDIDRDILLILGSDGLTDNDLLETYGSTYLLPLLSSADKLDRGANKLIELANEYNGHDNITTVLVRVRAAS